MELTQMFLQIKDSNIYKGTHYWSDSKKGYNLFTKHLTESKIKIINITSVKKGTYIVKTKTRDVSYVFLNKYRIKKIRVVVDKGNVIKAAYPISGNSVQKSNKGDAIKLRLLFEIEQYEDMKGLPFSLNLFFDNRINIFSIEENKRKLLLSSTFHNGILIEIGAALITLSDRKNNKYQIDTYENGLEYSFKKQYNQLTVECFSEYDSSNDKILTCLFEDFLKAYVKEYKRYKEYVLSNDKEAYDNRIFIMMLEQINTLNNISKKII